MNTIKITLDTDAYITQNGQPTEMYYTATARDVDGNAYTVRWELVEGAEKIENEDQMCDWDDYTVVDVNGNSVEATL